MSSCGSRRARTSRRRISANAIVAALTPIARGFKGSPFVSVSHRRVQMS